MSLSEYQPEKITIKGKRHDFSVRGLSFTDLSSIIRTHYTDLEGLFVIYEREHVTGGLNTMSVARYATSLIKDAPGLVAHVIALASDEPEQLDAAARLPLLAQVDALKAIGKLTFEEVGGAKKLIEMVTDLVKDLQPEQAKPANGAS